MTTETHRTIMLIEDDPSMKSVLQTLLEIEGFTVSIAPDQHGLEAVLQAIQSTRPEILLLDVHLRGLSGLEVVQRIRADATLAAMRVVMSSGMDVGQECLAAGADSFLMKPYMPDELLQKIQG